MNEKYLILSIYQLMNVSLPPAAKSIFVISLLHALQFKNPFVWLGFVAYFDLMLQVFVVDKD